MRNEKCKMKNVGVIILVSLFGFGVLGFGFSPAYGMAGPTPQKASGVVSGLGEFLIDNFESGSLRAPREWWTFDIRKSEIDFNKDLKGGEEGVEAEVGNYSLGLQGAATNWYAGGCGSYVAEERQDLSKYNSFQIDVYGNGPGSGTLKIELYDDDNNNWQPEQDPSNNYAPVFDDKYVYDLNVDWSGWKRVTIPLDDFVDDNYGVGDDVWNPQQTSGSGGLLQLQFICLGSSDAAPINYNLDNIRLVVEE